MPFSTGQQKLEKLCQGYKILHTQLIKYCRGSVPGIPGGIKAYVYCLVLYFWYTISEPKYKK